MRVPHHIIGNVAISIDGNDAASRQHLRVTHFPSLAEGSRHADVGGWKHRRTTDRWRITRYELTFVFHDGIELRPGHLTQTHVEDGSADDPRYRSLCRPLDLTGARWTTSPTRMVTGPKSQTEARGRSHDHRLDGLTAAPCGARHPSGSSRH